MQFNIRDARFSDEGVILDIFNYFTENSYAAYTENPERSAFFKRLWQVSEGYPFYVAENSAGEIIGFALLHAYYQLPVFRRAARITYFIKTEYTRQGLGTMFLDKLIRDARELGIDNILASISSLNDQSLQFHLKHGFAECGRFLKAGRKWGRDFDEVWMQKLL